MVLSRRAGCEAEGAVSGLSTLVDSHTAVTSSLGGALPGRNYAKCASKTKQSRPRWHGVVVTVQIEQKPCDGAC